MRKILSIIGCALLAVVIAVVAVVLVFEKEIPVEWVEPQIEEIKAYSLGEINTVDDLPDGTVRYAYERLTYSKDGDKTITTIASKYEYTFKKSGTGDNIKIETIAVNYTNNGQTKTTTKIKFYKEGEKYYTITNDGEPVEENPNTALIGYGFIISDAFEGSPEVVIRAAIVNMIENNLIKVTQKGSNIKLHLEKDNAVAELGYNPVLQKVSSYKEVEKTYDGDNVLTEKETTSISF